MVKPSFLVVLAVVVSTTVAASTLTFAQQTTPPPTPPAKPTPTAKPAPTAKPTPAPAKPTAAPTKSGGTAKPAATPTPSPTPPPPPPKPATDVRLKTSYTQGAQISENVMYLQGPRQRVEFPGVVSIDQCDLKRSVMLNAAEKKYRVQPYPETPASAAPAPAQDPTGQPPRGGVVTMTTTLTDTLERQPMFGLEARHVKSMIVKESSQRACDKAPLKIEMDAWYVDLPEQSICVRSAAQPPPRPVDPSACTDRTETRTVGDVKLGFPVKLTTTTTTGEGDKVETITSSQAVTELEITRLDKALFEVPADYVEANSTAEIVPALGSGGLADALFGSTADGTSTATPKKAGVIRIGVLEPVNHTDQNLSGRALRQDVVAKFKGSFDALPLAGSSPAEIEKEAARLECDYILLTDITEVKTSKSGGIGGALKKVSGGGDKDKHEVKLDYKLFPVGATQSPKFTGKVSASTGGFGVGSALKLAAFAGQMYLGVMGAGGMMNGMMGMGAGMGGMGGGLFDPRASAMTSMAASLGVLGGGMGSGDPSEQDMRDTVGEALSNAAKATMDQVNKRK